MTGYKFRPAYQNLLHVIVHRHCKVGVVAGRSELIASHDKEDKSSNLFKHRVQPFILEGHSDFEQVHNDPCEVDIADDHDVEVPEQLQLFQAHSSLPISRRSILQVPDRPDNRKQDCSTANQVDQNEHLFPKVVTYLSQI